MFLLFKNIEMVLNIFKQSMKMYNYERRPYLQEIKKEEKMIIRKILGYDSHDMDTGYEA